jgi:peptidoglycan/xylan/chitin deacetylase (PgdA/CDA1 family)
VTYNDGPDPGPTPQFLELLGRYDVTATFFLLGRCLVDNASLVQDMAAAGHELAVHGSDHMCLARKRPGLVTGELKRTKHTIEDLTGQPVTWYRPPYGLMTGEGALAARRAQLRLVLWSASGRNRNPQATTLSIVQNVSRTFRLGGTVLLHDANLPSGGPLLQVHLLRTSQPPLLCGRGHNRDAGDRERLANNHNR